MEEKYKEFGKSYINKFNNKWNIFAQELRYNQRQFLIGNRLRPCILLGGYLSTVPKIEISDDEYNYVIDLSICVEIIHKCSLLLDDWIDNDELRHGYNAFHIDYGVEKTVMFSLNLISIAIKRLTKTMTDSKLGNELRTKILDVFLNTIYDMSLGELEELDLNDENRLDISKIKDIIRLETTPLITNSFLLGYYAGGGDNTHIEKSLFSIGNQCGYIFQALNDLEPFYNTNSNVEHKGKANLDFTRSKKNIAVSLLYKFLSKAEIDLIDIADSTQIGILLKKYMDKYEIKKAILREVDMMQNNIHSEIRGLTSFNLNNDWYDLLSFFIDNIIQQCLIRVEN